MTTCSFFFRIDLLIKLSNKMASGAGIKGAQTYLQETYSKTMTLAEAEVLTLNTLTQVHVLSPPFPCGNSNLLALPPQ